MFTPEYLHAPSIITAKVSIYIYTLVFNYILLRYVFPHSGTTILLYICCIGRTNGKRNYNHYFWAIEQILLADAIGT